jgi:hypothetical protein
VKKSPLKRVSKKQQARLRIYYKLRADYLAQHPVCEVCGSNGSQDIHHKAGRGSRLNDTEHFVACCRQCHRWIHDNANEAREKGWLV